MAEDENKECKVECDKISSAGTLKLDVLVALTALALFFN
jgi:hypothetical protein